MIKRGDSVLFSPFPLRHVTVKNRFMRSATNEYLATEEGIPRPELKNMMVSMARSHVGLIVSGCCYVANEGRRSFKQSGMCRSAHSNAWKPIIEEMHKYGAKFIVQLYHAGLSASADCNGGKTVGVPTQMNDATHTMTKAEIEDVISKFRNAADLAYHAGADGVQLHCAHGFLLSNFLSPAQNKRNDEYGGSLQKRMRIVEEIVGEIRHSLPQDFLLSLKINGNDDLPGGNGPEEAAQIVERLQHTVDLFEVSAGVSIRSTLHEKYLLKGAKPENKAKILETAKQAISKFPYKENYNLDACKLIRERNPHAKLALCGGLRKFTTMEKIVNDGVANIISLSRPLIRDPHIIMRFRAGTVDESNCINCGACIYNLDSGMYCHVPHY